MTWQICIVRIILSPEPLDCVLFPASVCACACAGANACVRVCVCVCVCVSVLQAVSVKWMNANGK